MYQVRLVNLHLLVMLTTLFWPCKLQKLYHSHQSESEVAEWAGGRAVSQKEIHLVNFRTIYVGCVSSAAASPPLKAAAKGKRYMYMYVDWLRH